MKIVTIIPLKKGAWQEDLTYFTAKDIQNGSIVTAPLRNKKVLGLVISSIDVSNTKSSIKDMPFNIKKISEVKESSVFLKEYFDAAIETSKYFAGSKNNGITSLIPAPLRENYDAIAKIFRKNDPRLQEDKINISKNIKSEKLLFQAPFVDRVSAYKTLIRGSFAQKKSVFIVLPTEHDIKIFEEALSKGIEQFTISIHGTHTSKKIIHKFEQIVSTPHPVLIIGTAPFLCIPRHDLGTIILEHEYSTVYKMIQRPHFDLRFFAELFASKINAKFILGDTFLRYESIARQDIDGLIPMHTMQYRISFDGDINIQKKNKEFKILEDECIFEIQKAIEMKNNTFIFTLRKGLATMTICRDCNKTVSCDRCGAPLVLYSSHQEKKKVFVCNKCEREIDGDTTCEHCGSWNLIPLGVGTDTVFEYLNKIFPNTKIFKFDKDSVKTASAAFKIIQEYYDNPGSILVGTEMSFFYLNNKIPLSIIASFDSLWSIPSFKMSEKIIQIILSIIQNTSEKLIIQTKNENDNIIEAIRSENLLSFIREELKDRKNMDYPPFKRFIKITYLGNKNETINAKKNLYEMFKEYSPEIFSGFVTKLKSKYVTNALIKIETKRWSLPEITTSSSVDENLFSKLISLPPSFEIFVDPEDLL
ncbi:MAG: hypothetical protein WCP17_00610 [bacterium]